MQKLLIAIGGLLIILGLFWPLISRFGFGHLPGDIVIKKENFSFYFPLTTSIILSIVLSLILWLLHK